VSDDKPVILGADGAPAVATDPEGAARQKVSEREPLSVIQARLREETDKRARKAGRQM
jgi:hypothetical protein